MSQSNLIIENQTFPSARADINDALAALGSTQSGSSFPLATFTGQLCYRTDLAILYIYDGTQWNKLLELSKAPLPPRHLQGLVPSYNNTTSINVSGGTVKSSDNSTDIYYNSGLTVSLLVNGVNGLDSGTVAPNAFYFLYAISKDFGANPGFVFSTVNESASGSITLPATYTKKRQLPFTALTNSSSQILLFRVAGGNYYSPEIIYLDGPYLVLNGGSATGFTLFGFNAIIPPIARVGIFDVRTQGSQATAGELLVRTPGSNSTGTSIGIANTAYASRSPYTPIPLNANRELEYRWTQAQLAYMSVAGYRVTELAAA